MEVRTRAVPLLLLTLLVTLLLVGCTVGEVPIAGGDDGPTPDASMTSNADEASFNAQIKPLVGRCTGCHGATPPTLTSYAMLQAKYKMKPGSANVLVTKGDHQGTTYFDATDKGKVQAWIDGLAGQ